MNRDKILVAMVRGLMANPNIVTNISKLNDPQTRIKIIDMGAEMTSKILEVININDEYDKSLNNDEYDENDF